MIQRKQTIYLLLAFICNVLLLFFPLFTIKASSFDSVIENSIGAYGVEGAEEGGFYPIYLLFLFMALLTALGVAFYKKRTRQLMICRLNLIFHVLVTLALFIFYYAGKSAAIDSLQEKGYSDIEIGTGIGFYLVIAAIPLILLAIRGVKADEELVKSLDRLR